MRHLQWVYVRYTVTRPLRRLFSPSIVVIDPLPSACNNWCILPGNNAIRIIDLKNDECVVLQKDGFDQRYMRDLLQLRHKFPDLPGPKLLRSDIDEGWYAEERIRGLPLNRLDDYHRIQSVQNSAQQSMQSLYDDTSVELDSMKWIQTIFQKISVGVDRLPDVYSDSVRDKVRSAVEPLFSMFGFLKAQEC